MTATGGTAGRVPAAVLDRLGLRPQDADLTVVQFSTAFCGPCRATRARLRQLVATRPGVVAVDVDAESHLDAVRALEVRATPTLLFVAPDGRLLRRLDRAPRAGELAGLVDGQLPAGPGTREGSDV